MIVESSKVKRFTSLTGIFLYMWSKCVNYGIYYVFNLIDKKYKIIQIQHFNFTIKFRTVRCRRLSNVLGTS